MKWVFLAILISLIKPASAWLCKHPDKLNWPCFLIGFLPFISGWLHLLTAPISWAWIGYTKGLEVWVLDFIAIVILLFLRGNLIRPPFLISMLLYFATTVIATFGAQVPEASVFYCWQLLRVYLLYFVVANVCALEFGAVSAILTGLAMGELLQCVLSIWERFGLHILQTPGTMESQNELGLVSHFVILPFFAIMLGGRRGWLPTAVVPAALITYVLTTSRASVLLGIVGLCLVWLMSSFTKFSARKFGIIIGGLMALMVLAPLAVASFNERFTHGSNLGLAEDAERLTFKRVVWMMLDDHPGGVGPNNFAVVANSGGYYDRSRDVSAAGRASNVHNLYLLVWAETGPLGVASFILMLALPLVMALRFCLSGRWEAGDARRDILIGVSATLLILYVHSTEEWVPITVEMQYLLAIMFGLVVSLTAEQRASNARGHPIAGIGSSIVDSDFLLHH